MAEVIYRPAELDDAELAADLMTAAYPALAEDPIVIRYRREHPKRGWSDNDSENAPMLHTNEKLGYRPRPGFVGHLKRVIT